jgi:hypothetical protein
VRGVDAAKEGLEKIEKFLINPSKNGREKHIHSNNANMGTERLLEARLHAPLKTSSIKH